MKKTIVLMVLLLVTTALAVTLSSKEEALTYFRSYKDTRESNIDETVLNIEYTTDLICKIDYDSENINCQVCFFAEELDEENKNGCLRIPENATSKEMDDLVQSHVRELYDQNYPKEEVSYIAEEMERRKITVSSGLEVITLQYYCSTNHDKIRNCVSISGIRCYLETPGKVPWSNCVGGVWILV